MKKTTLQLVLFSSIAVSTQAQVDGYTFSKSTATYSDLPAGSTQINSMWTNPFTTLTVFQPFDIDFFNEATDNGDFMFTYRGQLVYTPTFYAGDFVISGLGAELAGTAGSTIGEVNYLITGTSPNKILKVEYKNVGFFLEDPRQSKASFQIWLYENGDIIEFRYGPRNLVTSGGSPEEIGIFWDQVGTSVKSIEVLGSSASPTVGHGTLVDGVHITDIPAINTVYRFTPTTTDVKSINNLEGKVNAFFSQEGKQVKLEVTSDLRVEELEIISATGQRVYSQKSSPNKIGISTQAWSAGLYIVRINTSRGQALRKILID